MVRLLSVAFFFKKSKTNQRDDFFIGAFKKGCFFLVQNSKHLTSYFHLLLAVETLQKLSTATGYEIPFRFFSLVRRPPPLSTTAPTSSPGSTRAPRSAPHHRYASSRSGSRAPQAPTRHVAGPTTRRLAHAVEARDWLDGRGRGGWHGCRRAVGPATGGVHSSIGSSPMEDLQGGRGKRKVDEQWGPLVNERNWRVF